MKFTRPITIEEVPMDGQLWDCELTLDIDAIPYTPASMYGGEDQCGWPAEGGSCEWQATVDSALSGDVPATDEQCRKLLALLETEYEAELNLRAMKEFERYPPDDGD